MNKKLLALVLLLTAWMYVPPQSAEAQTFNVPSCSTIPNPIEGQMFCFEGSTNTLKKYIGSVWVDMVGAGYNRIQEEGGNLAQESILSFIGSAVTCAAVSGKTECTFTGGSGSQHKVNGTDVTTNDPVNFRTTATVQATNPSVGNIDFNIVANAITNSHIADAALSAAKISGTAVVQTRTITTSSPLTGGGDLSTNRTITFSNQVANYILSGPTSGGSAPPTFRALVDADIPSVVARDAEINVQGTTNEITSSGTGVAPTLSIASTFRLGGKTHTAPTTVATTPPATCALGDMHFDSNAPAGQNLYGCTATDTWTLQAGGGSSSIDQAADYAFTGKMYDEVLFDDLPAPSDGIFIWVTNCTSTTSCTVGGGTTRILHYSDGDGWLPLFPLGGAVTPTLDQSFDVTGGNTITGANESKPLSIRGSGGGATYGWDLLVDSTNVPQLKCVVAGVQDDCNYMRRIPSGKKTGFENSSGSDLFAVYETGIALLKTLAAPATPTSGYGSLFVDSTSKKFCNKNDAGIVSCIEPKKTVIVEIFSPSTAITTGDGKRNFYVPAILNGMKLVGISANVSTVSSSGAITVDLARCAVVATGNDCSGTVDGMLTTALTVDANENKSSTAATPAVINASNNTVATDQVVRVDVDGQGTGAMGLSLGMEFQLP